MQVETGYALSLRQNTSEYYHPHPFAKIKTKKNPRIAAGIFTYNKNGFKR